MRSEILKEGWPPSRVAFSSIIKEECAFPADRSASRIIAADLDGDTRLDMLGAPNKTPQLQEAAGFLTTQAQDFTKDSIATSIATNQFFA